MVPSSRARAQMSFPRAQADPLSHWQSDPEMTNGVEGGPYKMSREQPQTLTIRTTHKHTHTDTHYTHYSHTLYSHTDTRAHTTHTIHNTHTLLTHRHTYTHFTLYSHYTPYSHTHTLLIHRHTYTLHTLFTHTHYSHTDTCTHTSHSIHKHTHTTHTQTHTYPWLSLSFPSSSLSKGRCPKFCSGKDTPPKHIHLQRTVGLISVPSQGTSHSPSAPNESPPYFST